MFPVLVNPTITQDPAGRASARARLFVRVADAAAVMTW
jgi:hypothetical protein